jgi:hypothetical protein
MMEGRKPGTLNIPGVGALQLDQWTEGFVWDNATMGTSISVGTEYEFYTNVAAKNNNDTNLAENAKLPEGWEFIVMRMGIFFPPGWLFSNMQAVIENSYVWFETGNSKIRRKGPTWLWPIGLGVSGDFAQDETAAGPVVQQVCQLGPPTRGAIPDLLIPIRIVNRLSIKGVIRFEVATTLTDSGTRELYMVLDGFTSRPIM